MKHYCGNTAFCRRKLLMPVFNSTEEIVFPTPIHKCCDICERECLCETCSRLPPPLLPDVHVSLANVRKVFSPKTQEILQQHLIAYRDEQYDSTQPLLFGKEIASGIPNTVINSIVKNAHEIDSPQCITNLGVSSNTQSHQIYNIVQAMY